MGFKCFLHFLLVVTVLINSVKSEENDDLIVQLSNGKLKGKDNGNYYSYESIPYAKAPVGELRFESPQPYNEKWRDVFDATKELVKCMQWNQFKGGENKLDGFEDCLYVSVYKPKKPSKEKYSVVVYIHGEAFMFGGAGEFGEGALMDSGNIILVKISYRLGPLGFLSTGDEIISGNNGLKDQQLALKWIEKNIAHFGGDSDKILLMGFSAGGASTHLQMLHPYLQGIAKAAISWAIIKNPYKKALSLAKHFQCPNVNNTRAIKHCLQLKQPEDIVASVKEFLNFGYNPFTTFGPVVENKNTPDAFMTQHPKDIIQSGNYSHVPWLASYTAQDGGYNAAKLLQINIKTGKPYMNDLNDRWLELATQNLLLENIHPEPVKYAQQLRNEYMGNLNFSEENYLRVQKLYTDILFKNGIESALKLHSESNKAPVYAYIYDNPSDVGVGHLLSQRFDLKFGTVHYDDFSMIQFPTRPLRPDETIISRKFIEMMENFVIKGEPSFGDCKYFDNAGNAKIFTALLITKDQCGLSKISVDS